MQPQRLRSRFFMSAGVMLLLSMPVQGARGQIAEFLGPHITETMSYDGQIVGTGRIGGIVMDNYGYLYVANQDEGLWKIYPSGEVKLFAEGFYGSGSGTALRNGDILWSSYAANKIFRIERDGTVHLLASEGLDGPVGMAATRSGDIYAVNYRSNYISHITPDGVVTEFVRDDRFDGPNGISADREGNLYVVNMGNTLVLKVTPAGEISEIAKLPGTANAHVAVAGDVLYVTQIWSHVVLRVEMDGNYQVVAGDGTMGTEDGPTGTSTVRYPNGIAVGAGKVYINTLRGDMIAGHPGTIDVRAIHLPTPQNAFLRAFEHGGMSALRAKFEQARNLQEVPIDRLAPAVYSIGTQFLNRGHIEAGMSLTEWMFEADANAARKHLSLANAHAVHGEKDVAIASYEKVLELNPENESAKQRLAAVRAYRR